MKTCNRRYGKVGLGLLGLCASEFVPDIIKRTIDPFSD